jgi:small-conductance mechanosensitive channel
MIIPDKVYNTLKWIALICIPAVVTFLSVVLGVLDVDPKTVNVIVTILAAIGTLIGSLIGVSTAGYNKAKKDGDANAESKSTES